MVNIWLMMVIEGVSPLSGWYPQMDGLVHGKIP